MLKNSDAISFVGGVTINRIDILLGYDFNISGLKTALGNKGAFEISFVYRSISTVLNTYSIPCERF
ncbi:MAG: type IX secretion system membrane protein PorP/SprF [Bacteroidales bacterium]|nr:type IX secretion system membrane protein PorP/SprF [Bacteroidales bacterium]